MAILYEEFQVGQDQEKPERMGLSRTILLGVGGTLGVLAMHGLIHLAKGGKPEAGPKGATRTLILSAGSLLGTLAMHSLIHAYRR